jgi:hypothetical protein
MRPRRTLLVVTVGLAGATALAAPTAAVTAQPVFTAPSRADDPAISQAHGQKYVNEPATVVGRDGTRYVAYQRDSQLSKSSDGGLTWTFVGAGNHEDVLAKNVSGCTSITDVGDVDLTKDNAGRVYFADLQVTGGTDTPGIQPVVAHSDNAFSTYTGTCAAHQAASVDREWLAAYTAPGKTASQSDVYLSYHDFGPNFISVNASHDGGRTFGLPVPVVDNPDAVNASGCDTVPAGTAVDPRNGWVYVAWTSGNDPATNAATGCNYTQGTVFNKFWVAVSKDGGKTFDTSLAVHTPPATAPHPSDMSEIFGSIAIDRQGGIYIAYTAYNQTKLEYDVFVNYSPTPGARNGDGSLRFGKALRVSHFPSQTAYFPRVIAGDAGRIDVIFLGTGVRNVPATAENRLKYDGSGKYEPDCSPDVRDPGNKGTRFLGKPCELPPAAAWYLYLAQSLNAASAAPTFSQQQLRADPVHKGDICTLGIFCLDNDNRDLGDVNDIKIDSFGGAQVAYTYETPIGSRTEIDFQCQQSGPGLYAGVAVRPCQR